MSEKKYRVNSFFIFIIIIALVIGSMEILLQSSLNVQAYITPTSRITIFLNSGVTELNPNVGVQYIGLGHVTTEQDDNWVIIPVNGTLNNLFVIGSNQTSTNTWKFTLMTLNTTDAMISTPLTCTIAVTNSENYKCYDVDTTQSIALVAGDLVTVKAEPVGIPLKTSVAVSMTLVHTSTVATSVSSSGDALVTEDTISNTVTSGSSGSGNSTSSVSSSGDALVTEDTISNTVTSGSLGFRNSTSSVSSSGDALVMEDTISNTVTSVISARSAHGHPRDDTAGFAPTFIQGPSNIGGGLGGILDLDKFPLTINDNGYITDNYTNSGGPLTSIVVGTPFTMNFMLYGDNGPSSVKHLSVFTNMQGNFTTLTSSDTILAWDDKQPFQIADPNHFFGQINANATVSNKNLKITFHGTFVKPMPVSNIGIRTWGSDFFTKDVYVINAWQATTVTNATQSTPYTYDSSQKTSIFLPSKQPQDNSSKILSTIKDWGGYSSTPIPDSDLLKIMNVTDATTIPYWVAKTTKWVIDGNISSQEFQTIITYLHQIHAIK